MLLAAGLVLILLSVSLNRLTALWNGVFDNDAVAWHQLTISPGNHTYVSSLDESTLVLRSSAHSEARLTLFVREDDGVKPDNLVKDLCGRDSCIYAPLDDARVNGAIADYASATPLRFVLMHPAESGIWLEYKGPPDAFANFNDVVEAVVSQLNRQSEPKEPD